MRLDKINTEEAFRYLGYGISAPDEQTAEIARGSFWRLLTQSIHISILKLIKMTVSRAVLHCTVHR